MEEGEKNGGENDVLSGAKTWALSFILCFRRNASFGPTHKSSAPPSS